MQRIKPARIRSEQNWQRRIREILCSVDVKVYALKQERLW